LGTGGLGNWDLGFGNGDWRLGDRKCGLEILNFE